MSQDRFNYLLHCFKANTLSETERKEWLALVASEDYRAQLDADIEATLAGNLTDLRWNAALENDTWQNILEARENTVKENAPRYARITRLNLLVVIPAAACVVLAIAAWLYYNHIDHPAGKPDLLTTASRGRKVHLTLSDGTAVWLDAASSLRYPAGFEGDSRTVTLEGQACFNVKSNPQLPFKVRVGNHLVEVLGTRFNIISYPADRQTKITLLEGSLRVIDDKDSLLLKPGQEAVWVKGNSGFVLHDADTAQITAWQRNEFVFRNMLLRDVMHELERWYDVQLTCGPAADTLHIMGSVSRSNSLEDVMKMLAFTDGLKYSINGRKVDLEVIPRH